VALSHLPLAGKQRSTWSSEFIAHMLFCRIYSRFIVLCFNQSRQLHHEAHPYESIMVHLLELLLPLLFCFASASAALLS
jgi:hypothetical protein